MKSFEMIEDTFRFGISQRPLAHLEKISIGIFPGGTRQSRYWPVTRYAEVVRMLLSEFKHIQVLIFGTSNEAMLGDIITQGSKKNVVNLCGKTSISETIDFLLQCRGVISNDNGGLHLSSVLGVPVVGIYGATNPGRTLPLGKKVCVLQKSNYKSERIKKRSWRGQIALERITSQEVFNAISSLLDGEKP